MKANPIDSIPSFGEQRSDVWILWYQTLRSHFGSKIANQLFIKAWSVRAPSGIFDNPNSVSLREELKKGGLTIDTNAIQKVADAGSGVLDFAGDVFTVGKWTGIALLVILVGGIGMIVYSVARDPVKAVAAGASLKSIK